MDNTYLRVYIYIYIYTCVCVSWQLSNLFLFDGSTVWILAYEQKPKQLKPFFDSSNLQTKLSKTKFQESGLTYMWQTFNSHYQAPQGKSIKLPTDYPSLDYKLDIKESDGNMSRYSKKGPRAESSQGGKQSQNHKYLVSEYLNPGFDKKVNIPIIVVIIMVE